MDIYSPVAGLALLVLLIAEVWLILRVRPGLRSVIAAEKSNPAFMAQLEGLRGLLAVGVVLHHAVVRFILVPRTGVWGYPPSNFYSQLGSAPVLMFFFLTGFLFWSKLLRRPHIEPRGFFAARLLRLGPVYLFAMIWFFSLVAFTTHFSLHSSLFTLAIGAVKWLLFTVVGRADLNGIENTWQLIAGTPWTLAWEWRFYFLLPFLVWFARRTHRIVYLLVASLTMFVLSSPQALAHTGRLAGHLTGAGALVQGMAGNLSFTFGTGMMVAAIRHRWTKLPFQVNQTAISLLCLALAAFVLFNPRSGTEYHNYQTLLLGLVFFFLVYGNTMWGTLRSDTVLLLGRCSYSLYLCHGLVLATVVLWQHGNSRPTALPPLQSWVWVTGSCMLTIVVMVVCHEAVEAPFMIRKEHRSTGLPAAFPSTRVA